MKRILFYIVIWLIPAMALADVNHLPKRTIEYAADGVIVTYQFENPIIQSNQLVSGTFFWQYAGFGVNDTPGKPAIPFRTDMFYIPAGYKAQINLLNSEYKDTALVLSPAIPNLPDIDTSLIIDSITPYIGFYPDNVLEYDSTQNYRGIGLQSVTIIPVKYNYETNIVRAYSKIQYKVTFVIKDTESQMPRNRNCMPDDMRDFLSNVTLNYASINPFSQTKSDSLWHTDSCKYYYHIITTNEYYNAIQDFVRWKKMKGYDVNIAIKPKGNWTTDSIKAYAGMGTDTLNIHYVLIIGGNDDVPGVPFSYTYNDNGVIKTANTVTDFYYGIPTASDSIPQRYCGRIPADNSQEVSVILNKIIQYEKNPVMDSVFYKTGLNCAEYEDKEPKDGYEDRAFVLTSENILNHLSNKGKLIHRQYVKTTDLVPLYWSSSYGNGQELPSFLQPGNFAWDGDSAQIQTIINNGVLYALHRDHGLSGGWQHPMYTARHNVRYLHNGNKLPVIFSLNCSTGKYNLNFDCFAEAFLKKENGGCVGIYAATDISFSGYNDAMALGMFDAIWPSLQPAYNPKYYRYFNTLTPTYELGRILAQGIYKMGEIYGQNLTLITKKIFHCFGDPSMQIYTEMPQYFAKPSVFSRGDSIFVFVEDGDCKITFYDKFTEEVKSYKGNYAAYANPSDSLVICLDRHNYVPYIWDFTKDVYIQNENIQGETRVYIGNTIYVGNHVTSTKPTGDVNIQNSNITIQGKQLELHSGTRIDKNFNFQNR